jgi:Alpha-L-fucosidase
MKLRKICLYVVAMIFSVSVTYSQKDSSLSLSDESELQWFKDAKFGMFIHWGLYSILEGSYNGHTLPDESFTYGKSWYAEWIQKRFEISDAEYQALAKQFNPVNFNADEWIREAKNAGMRYFAITSKHHDGFALWDSEYSDFDIMSTPYGKDILAELVAACRKYDIKYGFYYSHWLDWEYPGGALPDWPTVTQPSDKEFQKYWTGKCMPQVKELINKFDPDFLWFDTWGTEEIHITTARRDELIRLVRENSSKCLINGRISFANPGENIDFLEMMDNEYPEGILQKPWQTPATMQHTWGWHANDFNWKSSTRMLQYLVNNTSKGGNYLLNIGPKADGSFPVPSIRRLREMGAWLYANGESVYGASHVDVDLGSNENIYLTQKIDGDNEYLYVSIVNPVEEVAVPLNLANRIKKAYILETNQRVEFSAGKEQTVLFIQKEARRDTSIQVVKIELDGK